MAFLDFLFGSQEQKQELPEWYTNAAQSNISRAQDIAEMGYTPYYGVDVAGFTPMQQAAMGNVSQAAGAYGMSMPTGGAMSGMGNMVTDPVTGIQGYRSGDIFDQARNELKQRAPAQYDYYNSMIIDPVTGDYGSRTRGGEALGLLNQMGVDTTGLNANSSSSDYQQAVNFNSDQFRQSLQNLVDNPALLAGMGFLGGPLGGLLAQIAKSYVNNQATKTNEAGGSSTPYLYTGRGFSDDGSTYTSSWGKDYDTSGMSDATKAGLAIASKQNDVTSYTD